MKHVSRKKGFTLIELLIVITIIGILAAALLPSILGAPARARDAARKAHLNSIVAALETYNNDYFGYPSEGGCIGNAGAGTDLLVLDGYFQGGNPPRDPRTDDAPDIGGCDGGYYYYCASSGNPVNYIVAAYVEQVPPNASFQNGYADEAALTANDNALCAGGAPAVPAADPGAGATVAYFIVK